MPYLTTLYIILQRTNLNLVCITERLSFIVYWYAIFDRVLFLRLFRFWLCIEIDAAGYPDEHVAVCDSVVLGHAHADAVASRVDHGLEVTGRADPIVDSALDGIGCAGEHGQVVTEAIGITGVCGGFTLLRGMMPGVAPVEAGLGGVHQGLADRQFRHTVGLAGLVDKPDYLLAYLHVVCQTGIVFLNGLGGGSGGTDHERHGSALPSAVGGGDFCSPLRLGDGNPEGQHLFNRHRVWVTGGGSVVRTAGADNETAAFSNFQSVAFIAAYADGFGWRCCCCGGDGEGNCEDGCRQYGGAAFFSC